MTVDQFISILPAAAYTRHDLYMRYQAACEEGPPPNVMIHELMSAREVTVNTVYVDWNEQEFVLGGVKGKEEAKW